MPDFEELQEKKPKTIDTGKNANTIKTSDMPSGFMAPREAALKNGQKGEAKYEDALTEKYRTILKHDYKSQKWISKDKNKRKARRNINENYKLVTGAKKSLTGKQQLARKAEFDTRKAFSELASRNLDEFVNEREKQAKEWEDDERTAAAKEILDLPVEVFDFDSDKAFLQSFKKNMRILARAERLEKALLSGAEPAGFDQDMQKELSVKLSRMGRIREAYEDRIRIITSPYYVSVRLADLTLSAMDHLNLIVKGKAEADETLKSFAKAITRWKYHSSRLFTMGKAEKKEFFTDTIAENIILKNGIKNVNNCFNSIKWGKDKKGKLFQKKFNNTREVKIKEWIYDDLKLLKNMNRKQLSEKIALLINTLENANEKPEDGEDREAAKRKSEAAIAHAKKVKEAFDKGQYSKESVILWLDRYLMSDHRLCIDVYEGAQEQEDRRSKEEKTADHEAYLDQISGEIERFINSQDGLEAHFQDQEDPVEEKKKVDEVLEIQKNYPDYKPKKYEFQKVHFVGEKDEKAKDRHSGKKKDKLVAAKKGAIHEQLSAGIADFLYIYGENSSSEVLTRTYVSVKPSSKAASLKALVDTAIKMGIQKELYFKISTTARKSRGDDIVIYFGKNLKPDQISDFLDQYKQNCEAAKVEFSQGMEGVVVGRSYSEGINLAPEPSTAIILNKNIKDDKKKEIVDNKTSLDAFVNSSNKLSPSFSFTGLMVDLLFKSAVLAEKEIGKSTKDEINIADPKTFDLTKKYFRELCELNGIDTKNIVDDSILKAFEKKEKMPKPENTAKKEEKKEERGEERKEEEKKTDPVDDLVKALEGGDALFAKIFKEAYRKNLNAALRDVARRQVIELKKKQGIKGYNPNDREIRDNMPAEDYVVDDERVAGFLLQFKAGFEAGTNPRELDRKRDQFMEDLKKQGGKFPPVLNARLIALTEAMRTATRYVESRQLLINEQDAYMKEPREVDYTSKDLKDEKQIHDNSCWACSGTMNANNYIARHRETVDKDFRMTQNHFLNKGNIILNPDAKTYAMQDKDNLNRVKREIETAKLMTGGKEEMGNVFTMADVFLKDMSDTAVRRTQFTISRDDPLLGDPEAVSAIKTGMLKKITDMLILSGGPITLFYPRHYITVTGVKNGVILYHDSLGEKREKLDTTFEMTAGELLDMCTGGAVELVALVHLDEESLSGIKNEFRIGADGQKLYDEEGRLDPALVKKNMNKVADMERMFHNLGVEYDKPIEDGGALSKLEFMQDTIYLPKLRNHRENVEKNLPKQDLLENVRPEDTELEKEKRRKAIEENKKQEKQKEEKKEEKAEEKKEEKTEEKKEEKTEEKKEEKTEEKKEEKTGRLSGNTDISVHSSDFFQMYTEAMQLTDQGKKWQLKHAPDNETLGAKYRTGAFKDRLDKKERDEKIRDPRSELYRKAQNATLLEETVKDFETESYDAVNRAVTRQAFRIDKEEYQDLSAFMQKDDDKANFELAALYLGKSVKMQGEALEGQDVLRALDLMAKQLFLADVESLRLDNDTELVKNAQKLERISAQVAAFDRLMKKHGYLQTLKPENQERLSVRLNALRSIAAYYQVRKEIITDETYRTRYNDELSMNKTGGSTDEQRNLAEKLVDSLVLGRTMMWANGIKVGKDVFGGDGLDFRDAVMNTRYARIRREYSEASKLGSITENAFARKSDRSQQELERLKKRLKELNAIDPAGEQQKIAKHMEAVRHKAVVPVPGPKENTTLIKKLKSHFASGWRWFAAVPIKTLVGVFGLMLPSGGSEKEGVQKKRDHKMVPGRNGEEFRDEIVRKDEEGEDIDVYSDVRRGPLVWEKLTAGDPEDPPEVCIMVQQAKRGNDVALTGRSSMGHAMIGLSYSRYNKTTKRKERYQLRMGFWPGHGLSPFVSIPLVNGAVIGGSLQNDEAQGYDVALRYQVKPGDINKILRASEKYADKGYAAYKRNCTTFVMDMAKTINLPIVKEIKQQNMSFGGLGGTLIHMSRGANHPGLAAVTGNHMASRLNKMDLSYQNFGQKLYTKEEVDRFYKTAQYEDDQPFGYAPGPVGEQMRKAKTGELSALYEEDTDLDVKTIKDTMRTLGMQIAEAISNEIPEGERTKEDADICSNSLQIEDFGLDDLIKSGKYTASDLRQAHKEIKSAAKAVSTYYKNRLRSKASFTADIMKFLSLCEVLLSVIDEQYRKVIRNEVKGDAGIQKYDFLNIEKEFVFMDDKNVSHKIRMAPGVFEGYLLAGKTVEEAVRDHQRKMELSAREKAENADKNADENADENAVQPALKLTGAEKKKLQQLRLTYTLADSFASANRYILEKESFDEKDVCYAFKELPQMEKGSGTLKANDPTRFECMPSATYQAVIFESLLGGIKALSLDSINEAEERFQALDKYMTESFKAKPELAGLIFKYFVEAQGNQMSVEELKEEFTYMFSSICLIPCYRGTDFSTGEASFCAIRLKSPGSAFNDYLTQQLESIRKNDGKEVVL